MADVKISALTAAGSALTTQEFPANESGTTKKVTGAQLKTLMSASPTLVTPTLSAPVISAGSASAASWPTLASGTLLTTAEAGAIERDADCFYGTTDAGNRGYIPVRHFIRADGTRTFTSNTSAQAIFTTPANGRITLETGAYIVDGLLVFTSMSGTGGNLLLNLLGTGTATVGAWLWYAVGLDTTTPTTAAAAVGALMTTSSSAASIFTAQTGTGLIIQFKGTFEVTGAGTMIPSITMANAASTVVSIGSYISLERIGSTSVTSVGQWD